MNKVRRSKRETKLTRTPLERLESWSEQCSHRAGSIGWPKQEERQPRGHL
jgi:hypothetical protein